MNAPISTDVVIVGGGLAGGLASLALARAGLDVHVIDIQDPAVMRSAAFDGRTTALAYAAARVFRRLGLWGDIAPEAEPIRDILVTDGRARGRFRDGVRSPFQLHFDSRELPNEEPLGWIVENRILREAIFRGIRSSPRVDLHAPEKVTGVEFADPAASVSLASGVRLAASLVVGADGRGSPLRRQAGIRMSQWSYGQHGIVATVAHEKPHEGVAHEFFLPSGPFAILPMTENRASLVWTERSEATPAFMRLSDEDFTRAIADRFGEFLGAVGLAGPRWSYPLGLYMAQRFIAPRLALIGDAAHAIHPIAGQGFNLGVKDIAALADVMQTALETGGDIGSLQALGDYERWRRFDSGALALATDAFNRLFSNDFTPLRIARDIGMGAVGKIAPLRQVFMRHAGADLGRLPPLMQAER